MSAAELELAGGCVVVTGGGGLVGQALAGAFARRGANVAVLDRDADAATRVAAEVAAEHGVEAIPIEVDVTDRAAMAAAASQVLDQFGPVTVLCNNAGRTILKPFPELTPDDWQAILGVQLQGVLNGTYAFLPAMIAQGQRSHIVNTSSMSGVGRADLRTLNAPYVTAKFAVVGLSEVMRASLEEHGIGVSVLCPGFTRADPTNVTRYGLPSAEWYRGNVLSGDEVAEETVAGVLENRLHIFPHRQGLQEVLDRHESLLHGFAQAERTSPPVAGLPASGKQDYRQAPAGAC